MTRRTLSRQAELLRAGQRGTEDDLPASTVPRVASEEAAAAARYHGVAEEGVPFRDIAAVIARRLEVPLVSQSAEEANRHFGWFAHFAALDTPASSRRTRELLGWQPTQPGVLADLDGPGYFETGTGGGLAR